VPQRLLGPKPYPLDRLLAIFAAIYAEHAARPEDLQTSLDDSSEDEPERTYLPTVEMQRAKAARRRDREIERDEMWEDEVDHLTMSVKLWGLVSRRWQGGFDGHWTDACG
jgi:origin recognition complex subunit 5